MHKLALAVMALALSGCAMMVQTRVSAFHELDRPLDGQTFAILPIKAQEGDLEFQTYAKLVKAELEKKGMLEQASGAQLVVFMSYGIDDGKQIVSSYPIYGRTGSSGSYTSGTITSYGNTATYSGTTYSRPTYGVVGSGVSSHTEFTRYLKIDIVDVKRSRPGKLHMVYQGKATSQGSSGELPAIMPYIVRSIFEDFPGKSGEARTSTQAIQR